MFDVTWVSTVACLMAAGFGAVRWLRVAQREHYLAGTVTRFAIRWWWGLGFNRLLLVGVTINVMLSFVSPFFALLVAAPIAAGPFGLKLKGTAPGPLDWTRRLKTLAAITGAIVAVVVLFIGLAGAPAAGAALAAVLMPRIVDIALGLAAPLEQRLAQPFVDKATATLREVAPFTIALTGSYGKTTTKGYVGHLIEGSKSVLATPRSFNNSAGLSRAVNEHLASGTDVFVAEMGTYGPGEIAALVAWVKPTVAAITAIGPVHLERMKSEDMIVEAKSEIFAGATVAVLNVDDRRLSPLADRLEADGMRVVRCSGRERGADIAAIIEGETLTVYKDGSVIGSATGLDVVGTNVAIAVACAIEAGIEPQVLGSRLATLPTAPNRRTVTTGSTGATIIDDTFNANPAGARAALEVLARLGSDSTTIALVTPGMIELGDRQADENQKFAAAASEIATDVLVVGMTNRAALVEGAHRGRARVHLVDGRAEAVAWVKENLVAGDAVLYENDLPDHFP
ncbi:MAG: Mur ligase family protein [Acidimicrobiales bacterium]